MKNILKLLNVVEDKLLVITVSNRSFFGLANICNLVGMEDSEKAMSLLKPVEIYDYGGSGEDRYYISESAVYKLILAGNNTRSSEAQEYLCEEVLTNIK